MEAYVKSASCVAFLLCLFVNIANSDFSAYECPFGWAGYVDHCYRLVRDPAANRQGAKAACTKDGAYVLSVNSEAEHNFVVDQLSQTDDGQLKQSWWTSGQRKAPGLAEFYWEGDGTLLESFFAWINDSIPTQLDRDLIVYHYDGYKWGWVLALPRDALSYICEISKDDLYKIGQEERGPDYGLSSPDPATVERGPTLVVEPINTVYSTDVDMTVELLCLADAYPSPSYTWVRELDGALVPVDPSKEPRYTIVNGRLLVNNPSTANKDDGKYQCKPSNKFGLVLSNIATLNGGYLLDFPKSPRSPVEATSYQWATIECSPPAHYPAVLYTWYKNDIFNFVRPEVKPYIMVSNDGRLYFSEVTSDDVGEYYCLVYKPGQSLSQGKVSMPTRLNVREGSPGIYEPQIGDGFPSVYPVAPQVGDTLRVECWASGSSRTAQLVYTWDKVRVQGGGVVGTLPLPPQASLTDHGRVLLIPRVGVYDEGTYRCSVRRVDGHSTSKTVNIILQAVPYFTLPLRPQYADAGSDLAWRCEAQGPPAPRYAWFKNGLPLDNTTIPREDLGRVSVSNNWLTIRVLDAAKDSAMYQCEATNTLGTRYSTAELKILSFAPNFAKHPLQPNQYATEGGNATLLCRPEAAPYPALDAFLWLKDGAALSPSTDEGARVRLLPNGNLLVRGVMGGDRGVYRCSVSNRLGSAYTEGNLTVLATTTISQPPLDTSVREGRTTFLHCLASYNPLSDVTYAWYDGDRAVELEKVFRLGENRYQLWTNPHYMRGSGLFVGGLYIMNAQYEHAGRYMCVVESSSGTISRSANVYVLGPPSAPAGVYVVSATVTTSSAVVQWKAAGDNGAPITSYVVEALNHWEGFWRIMLTSEWLALPPSVTQQPADIRVTAEEGELYRVNVTGLRPFSSYQLRLRAENKEGTSVPSQPSDQFTTGPVKPDMYPQFVGGGGGKVGELTINWKPLELWQHNADGIGYRVHIKDRNDETWDYVDEVWGRVGEYVKLVGEKNFYLEYEVAVQTVNDVGAGPLSPPVVVRSAMGLPVIIAQNVRAQPYNATACLVHWESVADSRDNLKGKLGGYRVSYWREVGETELGAPRVTINGQATEGLVIGLYPNTPYYFDVMVWNEAGNGPKSQYFIQRTLRSAPMNMPVEVQVTRLNFHSIFVKWRGVSTDQQEEPLEGYMVRVWYEGENMKVASDYDAEKENDLAIRDLRPDIVYKLRVYAYSRGGVGAMSSPAIKFLLGAARRLQLSALLALLCASVLVTRACMHHLH